MRPPTRNGVELADYFREGGDKPTITIVVNVNRCARCGRKCESQRVVRLDRGIRPGTLHPYCEKCWHPTRGLIKS